MPNSSRSLELGRAHELGSIEAGKRADLVAFHPRAGFAAVIGTWVDGEARLVVSDATALAALGPMSGAPRIDPTATVQATKLGAWTAVGARTSIAESSLGDYSYVVSDCQIMYCEIGKFCSIAAQSRLDPGNHPLDRVALHYFAKRSKSYDMGEMTVICSSGGATIGWC